MRSAEEVQFLGRMTELLVWEACPGEDMER